MVLHSAWRDCQAWRDAGLDMSTTSNDAAKMYDATLTQYIGWYNDSNVGGMEATCGKMIAADPNFVMGHVIVNGLQLMGTERAFDSTFKDAIDNMSNIATKGTLSRREKLHVKAIETWAGGNRSNAIQLWEDILFDNPTDMLALKFSQTGYFYLGKQLQMRDSVERVIPQWKQTVPLYSYLYGMKAFGLMETCFYQKAEDAARYGLSLNQKDAWATHALAHVLDMEGRPDEGITFMSNTMRDWETSEMIAGHNFWHWGLYHIEKADYQGALDIYDSELSNRIKSSGGSMLDLVNATSFLFRVEMEGVNVGERWNDVIEYCRPHLDDHLHVFHDVHLLMGCLGSKQADFTQQLMTSLKDFVKNGVGSNHHVTSDVGLALCESFVAYDEGDYAKATNILAPRRYDVINTGGSDAQRDVFNLFLIQSALKSPEERHHKLAIKLAYERKAQKENSPLTDRLLAMVLAAH